MNNFDRVFKAYNLNHNSTCDYTDILGQIQQLKEVGLASTKLLEKPKPAFTVLNVYYQHYQSLVATYVPYVRTYILNNDKSCYFNVRAARQNPVVIIDAVIAILTKCVGYVDTAGYVNQQIV